MVERALERRDAGTFSRGVAPDGRGVRPSAADHLPGIVQVAERLVERDLRFFQGTASWARWDMAALD